MKLSLFTPTHNPQYILETYKSLVRQRGSHDYEWVILLNGSVKSSDLHEDILSDPHTVIHYSPESVKGIGALKRHACELCTGDLFIELDHDDTLSKNAFEELSRAYTNNPTGFFYSDFVNLRENGTCETYSSRFGWETYKCRLDGNDYVACRAFAPSARSICQIYYAPNHVRAWSRKAYTESGGHDTSLSVADDHDLVCKTYLAGVPFIHLPHPLYIYRRWGSNSFVAYNKQIQVEQKKNCDKYLVKLIFEECKRKNLKVVNTPTRNSVNGAVVCVDVLS